MISSAKRFRAISALVALAAIAAPRLAAQDTTKRPVVIGLQYTPGVKPGVLVLPIVGAAGDSIRAIIQRDLDYGDRLSIVGGEMFAGGGLGMTPPPTMLGKPLNYDLYAKLGASAVVHAAVQPGALLRLVVHDVARRIVLADKEIPLPSVRVQEFTLPAPPENPAWRMAIHSAGDEIENLITGQRGVSQSRILFVRGGKIFIVDADGYNERAVTSSSERILSPVWHPSGRYIAYMEFSRQGQHIVIHDLVDGSRRTLTTTPGGLNMSPVFTPDGKMIVYAHGEGEGTELVIASAFEQGPWRTITVGRGSDNTSPTISPDGQRIAFTSGRSGHPEIYITDMDGTNVELLTDYTFGNSLYNTDPDWSPDRRSIIFQSQIAGNFQLMLMNLRDRSVKQLTSDGSNENPMWAPDSRHVVFTSTRSGTQQLWVMDTESGRVRQLTRGGGSRLGAWSPRLGEAR
jgi:TolB protein